VFVEPPDAALLSKPVTQSPPPVVLLCYAVLHLPHPQRLMADCRDYFRLTGRRVTFEYTLMGGTNDQPQHVSVTVTVMMGAVSCEGVV
jgi:hypothetical protein